MPYPRTSIGPFYFWNFGQSPIVAPQETVQVESRPGVDGDLIWLEGNHGETFEVVTSVDQPSFQVAKQMVQNYRLTLVGAGPVQLWEGGHLHPFLVVVRRVRQLQVRALANATVGLYPPSRALLLCSWELHPVFTS